MVGVNTEFCPQGKVETAPNNVKRGQSKWQDAKGVGQAGVNTEQPKIKRRKVTQTLHVMGPKGKPAIKKKESGKDESRSSRGGQADQRRGKPLLLKPWRILPPVLPKNRVQWTLEKSENKELTNLWVFGGAAAAGFSVSGEWQIRSGRSWGAGSETCKSSS